MRPALIALAVTVALAGLALVQAQSAACQSGEACLYLPGVSADFPTRTPTATNTPSPTLTQAPTATLAPTATPTLPPPTFNNCQADPNPSAAPDYPVAIVAINKGGETVTLQNRSQAAIDLTGWTMCSIAGNQTHPIGGTLNPGQSTIFPGPVGSIWNNSSRDDGALYTPDGRLASYYEDL